MNTPSNNKASAANGISTGTATITWAARFRAASSHGARREVVVSALKEKLAHALGVVPDSVDASKPVTAYGVDSLIALELRNWMWSDFGGGGSCVRNSRGREHLENRRDGYKEGRRNSQTNVTDWRIEEIVEGALTESIFAR
jgi:hypothetical protein